MIPKGVAEFTIVPQLSGANPRLYQHVSLSQLVFNERINLDFKAAFAVFLRAHSISKRARISNLKSIFLK